MHAAGFIQDLAVIMLVAGAVTVLFHRLRQPVVLGYIVAGVIIGPHTPPFSLVNDDQSIRALAELGVVFLMFSLGLEFSLRKLARVGPAATAAALCEIVLMGWAGYAIGRALGWAATDRVYLGAILAMSSTTIIIKVLDDLGLKDRPFAHLAFGILIVEDILGIAMIALLSAIAATGTVGAGAVLGTLGKLALFMTVAAVLGFLIVPRLLAFVARFDSDEMLLVTVLGLAFGFCLLVVRLDYSVALGAFVIGAVMAESRQLRAIERLVRPLRDMFSAIFFVAIGLMIDPRMLLTHWQPVLAITLAVVVGKVLTCSFGAFLGGNDTRNSLRVGMGLAQIGEFSFIIASLGLTLKVTSDFLYPIAVAVSAITTLLTPYLIKSADGVVNRFDRVAPPALVNTLAIYTNWVGQLGQRRPSAATKLIRRWVAQMGLNVALITAVFIAAAFVGQRPPAWLGRLGQNAPWLKAGLWLTAAILSLPMFIATSRKLQALGLLIADLKVKEAAAGKRTQAIRAIVAQVIPISGTVILGLYVLILSSALLPTFKAMLALLLLAGCISWLLRRFFIKAYARAQVALEDTFAQPPAPLPQKPPAALQSVLREADLETIPIAAGSRAAGKLIRELELRTRTGANIVGIEREGGNIVNPSADEELQSGDQVLLLGTRSQLDAARRRLSPAP